MIGKLWITQLIEADLQIVIRICTNNRTKGKIEIDPRILKANYRSRANYLIENTLLEKRIIYDHSSLTYQYTMHNMTNLEAYYDRQLPNMG